MDRLAFSLGFPLTFTDLFPHPIIHTSQERIDHGLWFPVIDEDSESVILKGHVTNVQIAYWLFGWMIQQRGVHSGSPLCRTDGTGFSP